MYKPGILNDSNIISEKKNNNNNNNMELLTERDQEWLSFYVFTQYIDQYQKQSYTHEQLKISTSSIIAEWIKNK